MKKLLLFLTAVVCLLGTTETRATWLKATEKNFPIQASTMNKGYNYNIVCIKSDKYYWINTNNIGGLSTSAGGAWNGTVSSISGPAFNITDNGDGTYKFKCNYTYKTGTGTSKDEEGNDVTTEFTSQFELTTGESYISGFNDYGMITLTENENDAAAIGVVWTDGEAQIVYQGRTLKMRNSSVSATLQNSIGKSLTQTLNGFYFATSTQTGTPCTLLMCKNNAFSDTNYFYYSNPYASNTTTTGTIKTADNMIFNIISGTEEVSFPVYFRNQAAPQEANRDAITITAADTNPECSWQFENDPESDLCKLFKLTPAEELIGRTLSFTLKLPMNPDYSDTQYVSETTTTFSVAVVSANNFFWTYGGKKITEMPYEVTYNPSSAVSNQFRLMNGTTNYTANASTRHSGSQGLSGMLIDGTGTSRGYYFQNTNTWRFSDDVQTINAEYIVNPNVPSSSNTTPLISELPNLVLDVKPYKPTWNLAIDEIDYQTSYTFEITDDYFRTDSSPGMSLEMKPTFHTFPATGTKKALEEYYGWITEATEDTYCLTQTGNNAYTNGAKIHNGASYSFTPDIASSGIYELRILPTSMQYGIVASDPVYFTVKPSETGLAFALYEQKADGTPGWVNYEVDNNTFAGPNGSDEMGKAAYAQTNIVPTGGYIDIYYKLNPNASDVNRAKAAANEETSEIPEGYSKMGAHYIDMNGADAISVILAKNGAVNAAIPTIQVTKNGDPIITGIENVEISDENCPTEYFSLSGVKLSEKPANGICIERRGSDVRKVIIK